MDHGRLVCTGSLDGTVNVDHGRPVCMGSLDGVVNVVNVDWTDYKARVGGMDGLMVVKDGHVLVVIV